MLEYRYYTTRTFVCQWVSVTLLRLCKNIFCLFFLFFLGGDGRLSVREIIERVLSLSKSRFDTCQELVFDEYEHNSEFCSFAESGENRPKRLKSCRKMPK